jgi:hypothetical protein
MPAWEPAKKDGYAVGMLITIPVYFHLNWSWKLLTLRHSER